MPQQAVVFDEVQLQASCVEDRELPCVRGPPNDEVARDAGGDEDALPQPLVVATCGGLVRAPPQSPGPPAAGPRGGEARGPRGVVGCWMGGGCRWDHPGGCWVNTATGGPSGGVDSACRWPRRGGWKFGTACDTDRGGGSGPSVDLSRGGDYYGMQSNLSVYKK